MTIGEFIKVCKAPYNSITIVNQDSGGAYFESMEDIPKELYNSEIISFDSGCCFDQLGALFGLHINI